jgi:predicted DNA-binding protein with PD1-like motif
MQSKEKQNIIFIRLFPDEDVNEKIIEVCKTHNVKTAVVLSGIGQLAKAQLGFFKDKGDYAPQIFNKPLEILSLTGNICKQDDEYILHLHTVLGDEQKNAVGGHFIEGQVSITAEIVLLKTNVVIQRKIDEKTGLKTLFLE